MQSYLDLLKHIMLNGEDHSDRTGTGTRSVFGYQWRHNMGDGFPLLTTKKMPPRWIAEELFWFLSGSTDEKQLRDRGVDIWQEWATAEQCAKFGREEGELGPVYGSLWRNFGGYDSGPGTGIDQIAELSAALSSRSNSRRLIVSGWHPADQRRVALPPCHTLWQVKIHSEVIQTGAPTSSGVPNGTRKGPGLSLHLYARSIDSFLGLPFNIASYAMLLHLLAHTHELIPHDLIISFGDLHIYNNHFDQVTEQLSREPFHLPYLTIADRLKGTGLQGLLSATWDDLNIHNYRKWPKIEADVSI